MPLQDTAEITLVPDTDNEDFIGCQARCIYSSDRQRPKVIENPGSSLRPKIYNMGITPPTATPAVTWGSGSMTGTVAVAIVRLDSKRPGRMSEMSPPYPAIAGFSGLHELENGKLTITNVQAFIGDEATDTYDKLGVALLSLEQENWYLVNDNVALTASTVEVNINLDSLQTPNLYDIIVPGVNYVPPAVRKLEKLTTINAERMLYHGQRGFDCFVDMPRATYFTPDQELSTTGIISSGTVNVSAYQDRTYVVRIVNTVTEQEVGRAYIGGSTGSNFQLRLFSNLERSQRYTEVFDPGYTFADHRYEIRRQVVGHATNASRKIRLTHDYEGNTNADTVGAQWMVWQFAKIHGIEGADISGIYKVSTASGATVGEALTDPATTGAGIILTETWPFSTGTGLFEVIPDNRSFWIGRAVGIGGDGRWETTGTGFQVKVATKHDLVTMQWINDTLVLYAAAEEVCHVRFAGIPDPTDFTQAADFDITQVARVDIKQQPNMTCVAANGLANLPDGTGVFIGAEGPNEYNLIGARLLVADGQRERWSDYNAETYKRARIVVEPGSERAPRIRFFGFGTDETRFDGQMVLLPTRSRGNDWLNFNEQGHFHGACLAKMKDGRTRVIVGSTTGRLFIYGVPARRGRNEDGVELFAFPSIAGTQYGTGLTTLGNLYTGGGSYTVSSVAGGTTRSAANLTVFFTIGEPIAILHPTTNAVKIIGTLTSVTLNAGSYIVVIATTYDSGTAVAVGDVFYRPIINHSTASFTDEGGSAFFTNAKIRVAKIASDNTFEFGEIVKRSSGTVLVVLPDESWTFETGKTYRYIIGPRVITMRFPTIEAPPPYRETQIMEWAAIIEDNITNEQTDFGAVFEWALELLFQDSGFGPAIQRILRRKYYGRSAFQTQWHTMLLNTNAATKHSPYVRVVAGPDGPLYFKRFEFRVRDNG